jgi:ABC-type amino acid transport substrate-binding protein
MRKAAAILFSLISMSSLAWPWPSVAGTLDKIRQAGTIALGYREDAQPFSFADSAGQPAGYSIDLCSRIVTTLRAGLAMPDLKVRYVRVTPEDRIEKLIAGEIDIECGSTTRTISREERADFTLMTFLTGTDLLVRAGSGIDGISKLEGKKLGLLPGTTNDVAIRRQLAFLGVNAQVVDVANHDDGVSAVEDGRVDAYATDQVLLIAHAIGEGHDATKLRLTGRMYSYEPYALMVRQNDAEFRLVADRTLADLFRSGGIAEIYRKWFGAWNVEPSDLLIALYALQSIPE